MSWPPEFAEPQGVKSVFDNATVSDFAEQAGKEGLQAETPITHREWLGLIQDAGLKPMETRRASKVQGTQRARAWVFGAYVHGPHTGLTTLTKQRPWLAGAHHHRLEDIVNLWISYPSGIDRERNHQSEDTQR